MKKYEEMAEKGVRSLDGIPGFAVRRLPFFLVRPIFKLFRVKIEIKLDPENDLATWRFKVGPRVLIEEELPTLMRFVQTVREETGGRSSPLESDPEEEGRILRKFRREGPGS